MFEFNMIRVYPTLGPREITVSPVATVCILHYLSRSTRKVSYAKCSIYTGPSLYYKREKTFVGELFGTHFTLWMFMPQRYSVFITPLLP